MKTIGETIIKKEAETKQKLMSLLSEDEIERFHNGKLVFLSAGTGKKVKLDDEIDAGTTIIGLIPLRGG